MHHSRLFTPQKGTINLPQLLAELNEDPGESPYNYSVILLGSSLLHDEGIYKTARDHLIELLNGPNDSFESWMKTKSFRAWMLGRLAVAGVYMGQPKHVKEALDQLIPLLNSEACEKDEMSAWGWGYYLACVDEKEYDANKQAMLDAVIAVIDSGSIANMLWVLAMDMEVAATAKDGATYDSIAEQMKSLTHTSSLTEALSHIPNTDWHAWAIAKVRKAAAMLGKDEDVKSLEHATQASISQVLQETVRLERRAVHEETPEAEALTKLAWARKACVMLAEITNRDADQLILDQQHRSAAEPP